MGNLINLDSDTMELHAKQIVELAEAGSAPYQYHMDKGALVIDFNKDGKRTHIMVVRDNSSVVAEV